MPGGAGRAGGGGEVVLKGQLRSAAPLRPAPPLRSGRPRLRGSPRPGPSGPRWRDGAGKGWQRPGPAGSCPEQCRLCLPRPWSLGFQRTLIIPGKRGNSFGFDPGADLREAEIISCKKDRVLVSWGLCLQRLTVLLISQLKGGSSLSSAQLQFIQLSSSC